MNIHLESNRQQLLDNEGVPLLVSVMASNTEVGTSVLIFLSYFKM